ncbi:MAG: DedA family protein [Gammaproteobacteria bacterium]
MIDSFLTQLQGPLSLWGPFAILVLCGLGLPMPEDIVLILAGALAAMEGRAWPFVGALMYTAVLGGDLLTFYGGRRFGDRLLESRWMHAVLPPHKQNRVRAFYARHGAVGIFLARFLPGLRAPIFFSAGSMRVSPWTFLCLDGLAALVSVPLFVWIGHWLWQSFGRDADLFNGAIDRAHHFSLWLGGGAIGVVLALLAVRALRRRGRSD